MSAASRSIAGPLEESFTLEPVWGNKLPKPRAAAIDWLWHGYVACGSVTLLTSQWKLGKTTLLSILLQKLSGGGQLLGQAVRSSRALVLSEEGPSLWSRRSGRFGTWPHVAFFCRPLRGNPSVPQWQALLDQLGRLRGEHAIDLVVVDPLSTFLPRGAEHQSDKMLEALRPLERLTQAGAAVLLLHHPRKGGSLAGQAARGSGALCAYADVLMEMHAVARDKLDDRRRRLYAWSRHDETPREQVIELADDGLDYLVLPCFDEEFERGLADLINVLSAADRKLTRRQILKAWPGPKPNDTTVWRWLERAVEQQRVLQEGSGRSHHPYIYWLPGRDLNYQRDIRDLLDL